MIVIIEYDFSQVLLLLLIPFLPFLQMATFADTLSIKKMEGKEGLEALFNFATEGILLTNSKGKIVRINPSAEKLFGYTKGELLGKRVETLVPKKLTASHATHREYFHENPHARAMGKDIELFGMKKDGTEFPVEISLSTSPLVRHPLLDCPEKVRQERFVKSPSPLEKDLG